jgi:hypothetical protein
VAWQYGAQIVQISFVTWLKNHKSKFGSRPLRIKKAAYISIKNRIRTDAPLLGGRFTTHHVLDGTNNWVDGYFLSRRRPYFFNLALNTTRCAYRDSVEQSAWEKSFELAPEREPPFLDRVEIDPKTSRGFIPHRARLEYEELDGMTRWDWVTSQFPVIADALQFSVYENWTLHGDYGFGIGLHATINAPFLTVDVINAFMDRFLVDEATYFNPEPFRYRYEDIANWGLDANAVSNSHMEELA